METVERVQFVFKFNPQNQSNWMVFFTSKQFNKCVETQNKEGINSYNSSCGLAFWLPCETYGMNHTIKCKKETSFVMVCLIHGKLGVK